MAFLSEAQLEAALLEQLAELGFACASDDVIGPDDEPVAFDARIYLGTDPRDSYELGPGGAMRDTETVILCDPADLLALIGA